MVVLGRSLWVVGGMLLACALAEPAVAQPKFKNLKLLKGQDAQVMKTMGLWNKALGIKCLDCHKNLKTADQDDHPNKAMTLKMAELQNEANSKLKTTVKMTCFGCHRGKAKLGETPSEVPGADKLPDVVKAMTQLTVDLSTKYSADLKGGSITCGTCHHGQAKVPEK